VEICKARGVVKEGGELQTEQRKILAIGPAASDKKIWATWIYNLTIPMDLNFALYKQVSENP
jgi:hypothetical protein